MTPRRILAVVGTRPEVIKMAPVVHELRARNGQFHLTVATTAQHREMLDQVLDVFRITPDVDLDLMQYDQSLHEFASRALAALSRLMIELKPDTVLVQGDTTTVMTAALAAFYQGVTIGHVEAGLRSFDRRNPFPEELNRRMAGCLADLHFAPTDSARLNLLGEGVRTDKIFVTGNTIVDALQSIPLDGPFSDPRLNAIDIERRRVLLVTAHRRENLGAPLRGICSALKQLVARFRDVEVVYPVHLNPNVRAVVNEELGGIVRVHLVEPLAYVDLLKLLDRCFLVLTDSGGIQEEAPSFHKPVLVLRDVTERPELVQVNAGKTVGTCPTRITAEASHLLENAEAYAAMRVAPNPFGDGRAAQRIVDLLTRWQ